MPRIIKALDIHLTPQQTANTHNVGEILSALTDNAVKAIVAEYTALEQGLDAGTLDAGTLDLQSPDFPDMLQAVALIKSNDGQRISLVLTVDIASECDNPLCPVHSTNDDESATIQ